MNRQKFIEIVRIVLIIGMICSVVFVIVAASQPAVLQRLVDYREQLRIPETDKPQGIIFKFISTIPGLSIDDNSINYRALQLYLSRLDLFSLRTAPYRG